MRVCDQLVKIGHPRQRDLTQLVGVKPVVMERPAVRTFHVEVGQAAVMVVGVLTVR